MNYISIAVVSIFVGTIIACGGGGVQFAGAQDVVDSFDEFDFQDCEEMFFQMVGANSGLKCKVEQRTVEVYTFDGDAEALCNKLEFCKDVSEWGATKVYLDNVMLVVYDGGKFGNTLIADLQK